MCTKSGSELQPVDTLRFLMGFNISIPLVGYRNKMIMQGNNMDKTVIKG
jgi:hypothetical protein